MKTKREDFVVEANGRCFFCLTTVPPPFPEPCLPQSLSSLQYLSRYLGLDMRKIFNERVHVPRDLLSKVENARLKVQLCGSCNRLTESFSKMYRHLEKVEMEVATFASQIQRKLRDADNVGKAKQFLNVSETHSSLVDVGLKGKLDIIKVLREEVKQKCIVKCGPIRPSVTIKKMTMGQVNEERLKIKTSEKTFTNDWETFEDTAQQLSPRNIKLEDNESTPFSDDANDYESHDPDDIDIALPAGEHDALNQSHVSPVSISTMNSLGGRDECVKHGSLNNGETFQCILNPQTGKYQCKLCGKELGSKVSCKVHYNGVHNQVKYKYYKCNLCGKNFSQLPTYRRHLQSVHMGIRFKCQVCNKTFTQKGSLTGHLKRSNGCRTGQVE